jgi:hypothetical protein
MKAQAFGGDSLVTCNERFFFEKSGGYCIHTLQFEMPEKQRLLSYLTV